MKVRKFFLNNMIILIILTFSTILYSQDAHFNPCWDGTTNPFNPMNIILIKASYQGQDFTTDDEIALFRADDIHNCIASKKMKSQISKSNPLYINAPSRDDGCGFLSGDMIVYKIWLHAAQKEITFNGSEVTYYDINTGLPLENTTILFEPQGTAAVGLERQPVYYTLSMALSPVNSGTVTPDLGTHQYVSGEVVSITATPLPGYMFDSWGGDVANPDDSNTTVTMTEDRIVTAYFTEEVVPVELTSFSARYESQERGVLLRWSTATEMNNYGFSIERRYEETGSEWQEIGFVEGHGTTTQRHGYEYVDREHERSGAYTYRLKQIDMDGSVTYSEALRVGVEKVMTCVLHQNYPNPFNPETLIEFEVGERTDVEIELVDMLGRRVAVIMQGTYESGRHEVLFNARDLSSGIYFYRLKTAAFEQVRKLAVIK